jgi:hypothetical protein
MNRTCAVGGLSADYVADHMKSVIEARCP